MAEELALDINKASGEELCSYIARSLGWEKSSNPLYNTKFNQWEYGIESRGHIVWHIPGDTESPKGFCPVYLDSTLFKAIPQHWKIEKILFSSVVSVYLSAGSRRAIGDADCSDCARGIYLALARAIIEAYRQNELST